VVAWTYGDRSEGVFARTYGDSSAGVYAATGGNYSEGVFARTYGLGSVGVRVETDKSYSDGVYAYTKGDYSDGVYAQTHGNYSDGVYVYTSGLGSVGVLAYSEKDVGVVGEGIDAAGVKGESTYKAGLWGVSDNDVGLYAVTNRADDKYGIYTPDYLYAKGTEVPNVDVAEYFPATEDATPGTVVVIGEDRILRPSTTAYDTHVAGIVSTAPGVSLGAKEGGNPGEAPIAVAGRAPCKVDASNGSIHPGDLLTTSGRPGYAMKAEPVNIGGVEIYRPGTIIGKSYGTLESGTGTIEVIVTLQ
jgi:hypothetical protein